MGLGSAAALIALLSGCAETDVARWYPDGRCQAVFELPDGRWLVRHPVMFGRGIRVEGGATLHKGEVIDGVDLGAVLQNKCRDPSFNVPQTVVSF